MRNVEAALDQSGEYNQARCENMSQNQYRLKAGTIIGGMLSVPNAAVKKRSAVRELIVIREMEMPAASLTDYEANGTSLANQTSFSKHTQPSQDTPD